MAALEREHNYRVKSLPRGQHARDKVGDASKVVLVDWMIIYNDPSFCRWAQSKSGVNTCPPSLGYEFDRAPDLSPRFSCAFYLPSFTHHIL